MNPTKGPADDATTDQTRPDEMTRKGKGKGKGVKLDGKVQVTTDQVCRQCRAWGLWLMLITQIMQHHVLALQIKNFLRRRNKQSINPTRNTPKRKKWRPGFIVKR